MRFFRYGNLVDNIDPYYFDRGLIAVKKSIEKQEKNQYLTVRIYKTSGRNLQLKTKLSYSPHSPCMK